MHVRRPWSRAPLALVVAWMTVSCSEGPIGAAGPMGPEGGPGDPAATPPVISGMVDVPGNSPAPEGVPVVAMRLGPDGQELTPIAASLTDANGGYSLSLPMGESVSSNLAIVAYASDYRLRAVATASTQNVNAVTSGVADVLATVVAARGGLALVDFDATEIEGLVASATSALTSTGTNLEDPDAVLDLLLDSIGLAVSAASGGTTVASANALAVTHDPPGVDSAAAFSLILEDGGGFQWDVQSDGSINDGEEDAWDGFFELTVGGQPFAMDSAVIRDDRSVVVIDTDAGGSGLDVTRKVYVSPDLSFARYTESFANPGGAAVIVDVGIGGNLGSSESTDGIHFTASSDGVVESGDDWIVARGEDPGSTPSAWIFPGGQPTKSADDVDVAWDNLLVPAGGRVTLFHFAFQGEPSGEAALVDLMVRLGGVPEAEYYADATISDATSARSGGRTVSIVGSAGAVAPREFLTITNIETSRSEARFAALDGSFRSSLAVTAGDLITVTGDRGTQFTLTAQ
jgi:hypothetical protein